MTETQAKSGGSGASTNPVDDEAAGGAPATGRAAVGRATVPGDAPSPKFIRAPGMPPPPDQPGGDQQDSAAGPTGDGGEGSTGSPSSGSATSARTAGTGSAPSTGPGKTPGTGSTGSGSGGTGSSSTATSGFRSAGFGPAGSSSRGTSQSPSGSATSSTQSGTEGRGGAFRFAPGSSPTRTGSGDGSGGSGRAGVSGAASAVTGAAAVGAARVTEAVRAARSSVGSAASRGPRRARLNLKRIDPWSVMKFSFAVSLVLFIVVIVATSVLYLALDAMGVFESVNTSLTDLINAGGSQGGDTFKITARGVILTSGLIGLVNVVLFTALATLGAFVYNVCADLVGGVELTLAERD